ncbi:hypothetical protein IFM89_039330 [Coptis chinensis]|uniref:Pseudouridine synthase I TruA alpha/beta domain-containing protein n=1 Tax=Coptis chinensis TaxID=261450 RepID=A0A835HQK9_9MAGN|nr:hypothetical protein IFM89_039330 [Coptis chinensis]
MAEKECEETKSRDFQVAHLQNQLKFLQNRVKELELENAKLSSQLSSCQCRKLVESVKKLNVGGVTIGSFPIKGCGDLRLGDAVGHEKSKDIDATKHIELIESTPEHNTGYVCKQVVPWRLRITLRGDMLLSKSCILVLVQVEPTVESEIFKALEKTRLLVCDKKESQYTRCGRTDKGVSSVGQVISLFLRSKLEGPRVHGDCEEISPKNICEEIDYVRVLNAVLPKDIRVIGWCPVPHNFHARFSCLSREYKYLFWRGNLDLLAMEVAGKKFVGQHDFRNFCKMDAANVHNYRRHVTSFEISSCSSRSEGDELLAMTIKGSAFLWHQIRCMVAVLFMTGHGLEVPDVIDELLDINKTPRKPQYVMAPELPLILQSCEFEGLKFNCSPDAGQSLHEHLKNEIRYYRLQAAIFQEGLLSCSSTTNGQIPLNHIKKKAAHIPLMSRPTEPSYEERKAKKEGRDV